MDPEEVHLALRVRLVSIAELPAFRAWENIKATPPIDAPHVDDQFSHDTARLLTATAANGWVESTGHYFVPVFGLTNEGDSAIRDTTSAILAAFPPAAAMLLSSGDRLAVRGDVAPTAGPVLPVGKNKSRSLVSIPWVVWSRNPAVLSLAS